MSYILDALKKSEQERGQGSIPNVQTVHSSSLNYGDEKKSYWPYILIGAILLNLLAISYFIFDKEKGMNDTQLTQIEAAPDIQRQILITEEKEGKKLSHSNTRKNENELEININQTKSTPTILPKKAPLKVITKNTVNAPKKIRAKQADQTPTDYYDLSESIKNKLPPITVSAHVYSTNPLQRSIVINNNFMEEGEYISNKLILHEITRDGAIFDYEGKLINYSVVSKWQ